MTLKLCVCHMLCHMLYDLNLSLQATVQSTQRFPTQALPWSGDEGIFSAIGIAAK